MARLGVTFAEIRSRLLVESPRVTASGLSSSPSRGKTISRGLRASEAGITLRRNWSSVGYQIR